MKEKFIIVNLNSKKAVFGFKEYKTIVFKTESEATQYAEDMYKDKTVYIIVATFNIE